MAIVRDDRWLNDGLGRALAGAQVFYCTQPATAPSTPPPSPLATIYSDLASDPQTQPLITDGFGHAWAYADDSVLYTIVFYHPLFGPNPVVLPDQSLGGGGGGGSAYTPFQGVPSGTIDGTNKVFVLMNGTNPLTVLPAQFSFLFNGVQQIPGLGVTVPVLVDGVVQVTLSVAPQPPAGGNPGDAIYDLGWTL